MKTHKEINEQLAGFVLGELSQEQTLAVEKHLAQCRQCRDESERLQALLECAGHISKTSADEAICESVKQTLFAAIENEEKKDQTAGSNTGPTFIWRTIMKSKITRLAAAAVIIIAVLAGINYFGGSIDGAGVAWAELVERVEQSHNKYYAELLLAMEEKDVEKVSSNADALSEFWQGINRLTKAMSDPTIQFPSEDSLKLIREKTFYDHFEQESGQQIFLAYANEFLGWLNNIEDEAWINEIIHVSKQMEEYAEEIREPGRHPEIDFSYAEHCLPAFVTYCEWFEQLPWDNPKQNMMPGMVLTAIERDLKIARREIEALKIRDVDRHGKRCMQQALRNAHYLDKKIKSRQMVNQWKVCNHLTQKISELSGLMAYLAVASGDITQRNKIHYPEAVRQILTGKFANRESFADYFVEQVEKALDLCQQLDAGFE